jgi:AcrR family transcriptional regulator
MNEKFFDLKTEKQDRMINAALKIFALNEYQYASTDDIVKEAGISKGLLFHYFGSKIGLYTFLADYCLRYTKMETANAVDEKESDFFAILQANEAARLVIMKKFPYMQQFLYTMEQESNPEAVKATKEERESLQALQQEMMKKADCSHFRNGVDVVFVEKLVDMTLRCLMRESMKYGTLKPTQYHAEAGKSLDMLKALVM